MTTGPTLLLIADMSGYTAYMGSHRMSLAHAEVNTGRLLGRVIDAVPDFELIEIEGDAAFLALETNTSSEPAVLQRTLDAAAAMHQAFHLERTYVQTNLCPCKSCTRATSLQLKFVAHLGEVATQTIRNRRKLVGIDVIHVHRLLKNPVELDEYVLLSDDLLRAGGASVPVPTTEVFHDLEGIGPVTSHIVDIADLPVPGSAVHGQTIIGRLGKTLAVAGAGMPYMLGLRRRRLTA
ncbi:hypothetical protein GCM10007304_26950 [Rhodococcoides trifolii]|uniref:DUF2652 domain-containing protein n=1 Tax=Rhodococcoides trifolii TaxID=908250 RepID=A0A917D422_9NOCA|nr:DUF2652 domain-containing protein [Rhodococcus trifolii]GGG11524.1 hypothetical protein GCM10007304_26950 [Rhodococcus trifolii]